VGQLILLTDADVEEQNKFKEVSIGINYAEPKSFDAYLARMSLYSGEKQKYSINFFTPREERFTNRFKTWYKSLDKEIPEILTKIDEAVSNEMPDDEKKAFYDESFNAIKAERFTFKLPKGVKR